MQASQSYIDDVIIDLMMSLDYVIIASGMQHPRHQILVIIISISDAGKIVHVTVDYALHL